MYLLQSEEKNVFKKRPNVQQVEAGKPYPKQFFQITFYFGDKHLVPVLLPTSGPGQSPFLSACFLPCCIAGQGWALGISLLQSSGGPCSLLSEFLCACVA